MLRLRIDEFVPGVAPDRALAWWRDFREGREDHAFLPRVTRRILERGPAGVRMRDEARWLGIRVFRESVRAWDEEGGVAFEGENDFAVFEGAYRFAPDGEGRGTHIRLDAAIRLRPALRIGEPIARPIVLRILRSDLRHHAREMAEELR